MKMTGHTIRLGGRRSHSLSLPVHERLISREVVGDGEKWESDTRRLLSSFECEHVTHWSECCENSHLPVSCHAHVHSPYGMHLVHAVFARHASREDGKSLQALAFINIYQN